MKNSTITCNYLFFLFFALSFLNGCAVRDSTSSEQKTLISNKEQRISALQQLEKWTIKGKIAFLTKGERQSFSLHWQLDEPNQRQQLNLTAFLGINALTLRSQSGLHVVSVDGNEYETQNLDKLITSLTQLTIPVDAMKYWLKGLTYSDNDVISYDQTTHLPSKLTSRYNNQTWQIEYGNYQRVTPYLLAKKITIKQNDLKIKIQLSRWTL